MKLIILIIVAVFVFLLIMFPEFRALFRGFVRLFIKDMATTPEGAEAIFDEKINQARDDYNKADDSWKKAEGRLSAARHEYEQLNAKLASTEKACENLVASGKIDLARIKAEEREEILVSLDNCKKKIKVFEEAAKQTKELHDMCEERLRKLKKQRNETIDNMRTNQQLKEVYDDMDELKRTTGTDKLLEAIHDKNKDLEAMAQGSKVVHDNSLHTRQRKAEIESRKMQSDEYLLTLQKKYNKK